MIGGPERRPRTEQGTASARGSGPVAGIVLAAGSSSRLGTNKLLVELDGRSVLRRSVERVAAAGLAPVIVVLGHEADRAAQELAGLAWRRVDNPDFPEGIQTSLRAGIAAVPGEAVAALFVLADMHRVTAQMLATMVARYRASAAPLVVSDYEGVDAPPTLFDGSLFAEILALRGEGCSRRIVKRHRTEALCLRWPASRLEDLDAPADLERAAASEGGR